MNLLTPASVHYGNANDVIKKRNQVLEVAYQTYPINSHYVLSTISTTDRLTESQVVGSATSENHAFRSWT